ncbi:MAG: SDR family oxidoreductase [Actinobacteria bacterium]|nr:SDR family oxidoreductase [Actinomycetota bacterium]
MGTESAGSSGGRTRIGARAREGTAPATGDLAGRRILVIGGGQDDRGFPDDAPIGNGRAISVLAARNGAHVAITDLLRERAEGTAALVRAEGHEAITFAADAGDEAAMTAVFADAVEALGGLDGIVVNVGVGGPAWLSGTSADQWDRAFAANVRSHFLACKLGLAHLAADSSIVMVASVAGTRSGSRIPSYDSSKAALGGLMRHAAFEGQRQRIRVNVVAPGLIDTSIGREATRHRPSRTAGKLPLGREGTGWEVAELVGYLLSDRASYVNAQWIGIDGGL